MKYSPSMPTDTVPTEIPTAEVVRHLVTLDTAQHPFVKGFLARAARCEVTAGMLKSAVNLYWATQPKQPKQLTFPLSADPTVRLNAFPGICAECGQTVLANQGRLGDRVSNGRVSVHHLEGDCPLTFAQEMASLLRPEWKGRYAVRSLDRHDIDFIFFNVLRDGSSVIRQVIGGRGPVAVSEERQVRYAKMLSGLDDAARRLAAEKFGQELGVCYRCGSELTVPASRASGVGPECAKKMLS
jgi:Family of unknown function (DUF6011)